MTKVLRITAKVDGHRRAGIAHPDTAVDHPAGAFDEQQIAALNADPMLVVHEIDVADPAPEKAPPKAPPKAPAGNGRAAGK